MKDTKKEDISAVIFESITGKGLRGEPFEVISNLLHLHA